MEDHTTTDSTLAILRELRKDFPETGAVLQAYLHRTEADCRALAHEGSRVRLCKGAYNEPDEVAFQDRVEVDKSYVRCLKVLLGRPGLPDDRHPRPADGRDRLVAGEPLRPAPRAPTSSRCSTASGPRSRSGWPRSGETVRVYLPYGEEWYGYLMRRLAERPQNLSFFLKSLISKK